MSSITGGCESPANLLFQQGIEKSLEQTQERVQENKSFDAKMEALDVLKEQVDTAASNETSQQNASQQQSRSLLQEGAKGLFVNELI